MPVSFGSVIEGVEHEIGREAVIVRSRDPLVVVSTAIAGGGFATARTILNLHVARNFQCADWRTPIDEFARRRGSSSPWVGLLTSAWTEHAEVAVEEARDLVVLAVVTVGLGNPITAGVTASVAATPSTINTIVVVDAAPAAAAMVNAVVTTTEVKTAELIAAGVTCEDGRLATGTSTDAVVIAATGRGERFDFGGPVSELGSLVARTTRRALATGIRRWQERHRAGAPPEAPTHRRDPPP